jgi:malate dehydrogenase (oxaloacetate-decarboxylating)
MKSSSIDKAALQFHKKYQGKLITFSVRPIKTKQDLSLVYTPGVGAVSKLIAEHPNYSFKYTMRGRTIAVVSDGSAVLGLGNIGPEAALPVMEGKSLLMREFAGVDSVPLVINTQDASEIIKFVSLIAPTFAGINLEDISAPRCFQIEEALQDIGIPVFHDDQHGTAVVVTAALKNAAKVVGKKYENLHVVIVGAGAAGLATAKMLLGLQCRSDRCEIIPGGARVKDVIVVDKKGAILPGRDNLNIYKQAVASLSNIHRKSGSLLQVIEGTDVIIGVSGPGSIKPEMIKRMAPNAIVFAMANPIPEIMPEDAKAAGAAVVATGRSDLPNQINNALAFPGIFRAVIKGRLKTITPQMKQAASDTIARMIKKPTAQSIIPGPFTPKLAETVAKAVLKYAKAEDKIIV